MLKIDHTKQITQLKAQLQSQQAKLIKNYLTNFSPAEYLLGRANLVDEVLGKLWQIILANEASNFTLIAVGGYGRSELYPASDVDILILLNQDVEEVGEINNLLSNFISCLWDIGLEVGHSVRTIEQCLKLSQEDISIKTNLLEARYIIGNLQLFEDFRQKYISNINPEKFYQQKRLEQAERYVRFEDNFSNLEPNCKESPGGLRDIHMVFWIAKSIDHKANWQSLVKNNLISNQELKELQLAEKKIQQWRIGLHILSKRREDRLIFDFQTALAEMYSFQASAKKTASEQIMQQYYRATQLIRQICNIVVQNLGEIIFPLRNSKSEVLDQYFSIRRSLLEINDDNVFIDHPEAILQSFAQMQNNQQLRGFSARTMRAIWRAKEQINPAYRQKYRQEFLAIFQRPQGVLHELQRMNQLGILGKMLPAWGKIVGQMQHDLFHIYTVDQHSLMVLRYLRRFADERFIHEFPQCSQLMRNFEPTWILYIAAIFHDIAKGRGGDHALLGKIEAEKFCKQHGIEKNASKIIVWLVENHLLMSQVAQKSDLSDPDVIANFAAKVINSTNLVALYLLTIADIRGTSPKIWNQWKERLLNDLFRMTSEYLQNNQENKNENISQGIIAERQAEALKQLRYFALSDTVQEQFWKQLDSVYFLRHSSEEIAWHTRALYYRIHQHQPVVCARTCGSKCLQVMVYTPNSDGIFANIIAFLTKANYEIVEANIHTTEYNYALDSFFLLGNSEEDASRGKISYIEHELAAILSGKNIITPPVKASVSRRIKHFPIQPEISLIPDAKGNRYILEVNAANRRGLLYQLANVFRQHSLSIHLAKISTLGERVEDVFLISGGDLVNSTSRLKLETDLAEILAV